LIVATAIIDQPPAGDIQLAGIMQALGDETRLKIVRILAIDGEQACGAIPLPVSKATRSHHFKVLREAGITDTRFEGTRRYITLRNDDLEARFPGLLDAVLSAS
jgi:DNA-binding transcriptional ArsR family regulator